MNVNEELEKLAIEYNNVINKINEVSIILNNFNIRKIEIEGAIKVLNNFKEEDNKKAKNKILNEGLKHD